MSLLSSLKVNKVYVVYQIMFFQPPAHALKGSMRHATTSQLSCSTWKVSLDTVTSIYLPTDSAATDPPAEDIMFRKAEYGMVALSAIATACDSLMPHPFMTMHRCSS